MLFKFIRKIINPVIVIPIYKESPLSNEVKSLKQCIKILGNYDIFFVCASTLNTVNYENEIGRTLKKIHFDIKYFQTISGYNSLLLSCKFYKYFKNYTHLLVYQLDAWVFKDNLVYWCKQNYDYIGAPWINGESKKFFAVGNGGFSLRKIQKSYYLLLKIAIFTTLIKYAYNLKIIKLLRFVFRILKLANLEAIDRINSSHLNEDYIFGVLSKKIIFDFISAPPEVAMHFSFEMFPSFLYMLNNQQLPFGCHAWEKYEPEFWKEHIVL